MLRRSLLLFVILVPHRSSQPPDMSENASSASSTSTETNVVLSMVLSPSPQIKQHIAGNLTGDLRKVKDMAADIHNGVGKWESLNSQGMTILTDMANMMIDKVFNTNEESDQRESLPLKLQLLCDSLEQAVESMERIVAKLSQKLTLAEGLVSLQQFKKSQPTSQVLFLTMTLEDVASTVRVIVMNYRKELQLKQEIYKSVAHSCDRDTVMFHLASWMHQPYIDNQTADLLQALIKDTGHVK